MAGSILILLLLLSIANARPPEIEEELNAPVPNWLFIAEPIVVTAEAQDDSEGEVFRPPGGGAVYGRRIFQLPDSEVDWMVDYEIGLMNGVSVSPDGTRVIVNSGITPHFYRFVGKDELAEELELVPQVTYDEGPKGFIGSWVWVDNDRIIGHVSINDERGYYTLETRLYLYCMKQRGLARLDLSRLELPEPVELIEIEGIADDLQRMKLNIGGKSYFTKADLSAPLTPRVSAKQGVGKKDRGGAGSAGRALSGVETSMEMDRGESDLQESRSGWLIWILLAVLAVFIGLLTWRRQGVIRRGRGRTIRWSCGRTDPAHWNPRRGGCRQEVVVTADGMREQETGCGQLLWCAGRKPACRGVATVRGKGMCAWCIQLLRRAGIAGAVLCLCPWGGEAIPAGEADRMPWIRVSEDGKHFVEEGSGRRFVVWGVNYDRDDAGRLLEDYWAAEWATVEEDFREMKELGANLVRIHLQLGKFMESPELPDAAALERLGRLVRLAEETGLYLDVTGLGCYHKAEVPSWYDGLVEAERWDVQARFWRAVAGVCRESPAVFCYDLMNEPLAGSGGDGAWLAGELGGKHYVQRITRDLAGRTQVEVARDWIRKLTSAIREVDSRHMITVGVIPWAHVFKGAKPLFHGPEAGAPLDFVSVHFYPKAGKVDEALEALKVYEADKPLLVEEMFPLECSIDELVEFVDGSREVADGWVSFYWGRTAEEYAQEGGLKGALLSAWLRRFRELGQAAGGRQ